MKKNRLERVNSLLKEVISEVIQRDVQNPHINTFVTITKVETSADLQHARVYISILAPQEAKDKIIAALQSAAGFIAVNASKKVKLRYFPKLTFKLDMGLEKQLRIQELLSDIEKQR